MRFLRVIFLISLGGTIDSSAFGGFGNSMFPVWLTALGISGIGWAWMTVGEAIRNFSRRVLSVLSGRPLPLPETDPKALAAEIRALNAQLSQLRDTATSFDVSFDQTLERLNDRLSRLERQSAYIHAGRGH